MPPLLKHFKWFYGQQNSPLYLNYALIFVGAGSADKAYGHLVLGRRVAGQDLPGACREDHPHTSEEQSPRRT